MAPKAEVGTKVAKKANEQLFLTSPLAAAQYVRILLTTLQPAQFCRSEQMSWPPRPWHDIYGLENDEGRWFVKFQIENDILIVASCHAPAFDLTLASGAVIKKGTPK